ncbi:hypothetical protein LC612_30200, partial [Nostoc sp. CHAB 5834]|nr:hypothetical protein [Nostoc sp. CHAB 5834]
ETEGLPSVVLMTPQALPAEISSRNVSIELEPGATVHDVVAVLGRLGLTVILADATAGQKSFYLPRFNGNVGTLLSAITRATDVWFTWQDGAIVVSPTEQIGISVPQEATFGAELTKGLTSLGIKDQAVHWQSGMATLSVAPSQFRSVKLLLERFTANAAVVTLQVAVVNVTLNQTAKQGIDWDRLQLSVLSGGDQANLNNWLTAVNGSTPTPTVPGLGTGTGTNTGSGTGTNTGNGTGTGNGSNTGNVIANAAAAAAATTLSPTASMKWAGSALSGAIFNNRFSFQGLFNYLQNYGTAEAKQNVLLKTVAGSKVEFKSLTQIPYVSEVGVTTVGNNGSASNSLGSSKTEKADDGITVEMLPTYDSAANSVTIDLKLSIKAVVAFNELSAGNQIGKMTQPTTAERGFTDNLRLRPGQTVVVGGLTYDSVSDSRGAPIFLSGSKLESQALTVNRQTMFIVVRPTVSKLGQLLAQESGAQPVLPFLPKGEYKPEEPEALSKEASAKKSDVKAEGKSESKAEAATKKDKGGEKKPSLDAKKTTVEKRVETKVSAAAPVQEKLDVLPLKQVTGLAPVTKVEAPAPETASAASAARASQPVVHASTPQAATPAPAPKEGAPK